MRIAPMLMLLSLAGCVQSQTANDQPEQQVIERVERELMKLPCVGSMADWERSYWYEHDRSGDINRSIIEIDLRQAGFEEFRSGRYTYAAPPNKVLGTDHRKYRAAFGSFAVQTGRITMTACGENAD